VAESKIILHLVYWWKNELAGLPFKQKFFIFILTLALFINYFLMLFKKIGNKQIYEKTQLMDKSNTMAPLNQQI
jgi:hypothetical protein